MRLLPAISLISLLANAPALAQAPATAHTRNASPWGLIDAIGYGGIGFAVTVPAAFGASLDDGISMLLVGTVVGMAIGGAIGHGAAERIHDGRPVSAARKTAVGIGTITAGAALGMLAAIPLVNPEGAGTPLGSDEQTFALTAGAGAVLGGLFFHWRQREFTSVVGVALRSTRGGPGMGVRVRF